MALKQQFPVIGDTLRLEPYFIEPYDVDVTEMMGHARIYGAVVQESGQHIILIVQPSGRFWVIDDDQDDSDGEDWKRA